MINILVRTSNRPNEFKKCIDSITNQTYENFRIICCYDDLKSKDYVSKITDKRMESFYIKLNNCYHYKYNLYCNFLLNKVKDGWIMFLDDDDMLSSNTVLEIIMKYSFNKKNLIFWKVLIKDQIIYPNNLNNINIGEIANSGFCFHSSFKNYSNWECKRGSDYLFIKKLQSKVNFKNVFLNKQFVNTQIGPNRGKKLIHKMIEDYPIEHMFLSKKKYNDYFNFKEYDGNSVKSCLFVGICNKEIINNINNYKGYSYVLFQDLNELPNLIYIKKTKNIKLLLPHYINQSKYIYLMHNNVCSLHYDVIYTDCK